jgi:D-alanyl-D-alanine carboxypeptidase
VLAAGLLFACGGASPSTECEADAGYRGYLGPSIDRALQAAAVVPKERVAVPTPTQQRLDASFAQLIQEGEIVEASAAILTDDGKTWSSGSKRFWWGSIGKCFSAMLVLELQEQGKLELSTPIAEFMPTLAHADVMTIRHLLTHTSGVANFPRDDEYRRTEWKYVPPGELIARGVARGPKWCPGTQWGYSNTGYLILGQIIEAVTGRPYHQAMNETLLARLGETSLAAIGPESIPADVVLPAGERPANITTPFAAGALVGSAFDMALAWKQFLAGQLIPEHRVRDMFATLYATHDPRLFGGLGVGVHFSKDDLLVAHTGSIPGAKAYVGWSWRHRAVVAFALTGEGNPRELAVELLEAVELEDDR